MKNGEHIMRESLVYSVTRDAAFCFCCKMFNVSSSSLASIDGYCNWQHISSVLQFHETSNHQLVAQKSWIEFIHRLKSSHTQDAESQRLLSSEINHWHAVLIRIVSVIKTLGQSYLAFQGKTDKPYERNFWRNLIRSCKNMYGEL